MGYGGGGGYTKTEIINVQSAQTVNVSIGAGGTASSNGNTALTGGAGGSTAVGAASANGGDAYGNGGSGGGACSFSEYAASNVSPLTNVVGGSNGSNGSSIDYTTYDFKGSPIHITATGKNGQGTTTRAFAETTGTLYSGGGGGGYGSAGGAGGGGRCGTGYFSATPPGNGEANTGGGGGGCSFIGSSVNFNGLANYSGCGGSGIAIIKW